MTHPQEEFVPQSPAETALLERCITGERLILGEGTLPTERSEDNEIRAGLIRALLRGQVPDIALHDKGIRIRGGWISGMLDLQGVEITHDISLSRCHIDRPMTFLNARMRGLYLSGSSIKGFSADTAHFAGSVYLRAGLRCEGEISMPGARIDGDLQLCNATLDGKGGASFFATGLKVGGSVYLGDYPFDDEDTELHAAGALIFSSARVDGDVFCKNTAIAPPDTYIGHMIYLDGEERGPKTALSLAGATIGGVYFFKRNQISGGIVNLSGASSQRLNDEPAGDMVSYRVRLDGFTYEDFARQADISLKNRLDWLSRQPEGDEFAVQPYEQFARTLQRIGHRDEAQKVLITKEYRRRRANRQSLTGSSDAFLRKPLLLISDSFLRWLVAYGYRPSYAVFWGVILIAALTWFFDRTWKAGDFAPNAAPILVSKDWVAATQSHPENPAAFWSDDNQAGQDYETFHPLAYAADLVIPIVSLGQEAAWAPSTTRSPWGWHGWWLRWISKGLGWVITALGAAAVTGVIRRE